MSVVISDELLQTTHMSADELMQELAILLYQKEKLSMGQACRLAGMHRLQFQHLLASREIPIHYDMSYCEQDLKTLRDLN